VSALSAAIQAVFDTWLNPTSGKMSRLSQASIPLAAVPQDNWAQLTTALIEGIEAVDAAIASAGGNFADPVASIAALKAVAAADRQDKQLRVVETDSMGRRSIAVFDSASTATGDDYTIVAPTSGTGRWFMVSAVVEPIVRVINTSGSPLVKGQGVSCFGYDTTTGLLAVGPADMTGTAGPPPSAIALNAISAGAQGAVGTSGINLASTALNTSGAILGDPVFLDASGLLTLTPPSDTGLGLWYVGNVTAVSATGSVGLAFTMGRAPGRARGVASIAAGDTTASVAVGTRYNGKRAQVSFAADPGTASVVWSGVVSGGNLPIEVDAAPGGSGTSIYWAIDFVQ